MSTPLVTSAAAAPAPSATDRKEGTTFDTLKLLTFKQVWARHQEAKKAGDQPTMDLCKRALTHIRERDSLKAPPIAPAAAPTSALVASCLKRDVPSGLKHLIGQALQRSSSEVWIEDPSLQSAITDAAEEATQAAFDRYRLQHTNPTAAAAVDEAKFAEFFAQAGALVERNAEEVREARITTFMNMKNLDNYYAYLRTRPTEKETLEIVAEAVRRVQASKPAAAPAVSIDALTDGSLSEDCAALPRD